MRAGSKMSKKIITVGMGEIFISHNQNEQFIACGLGSCIGLTMYEPECKIAGMAHLVLPDSKVSSKEEPLPGKFVDSGFDYLLENLVKLSASPDKIIVSIAGGAQMLNLKNNINVLNIGLRNITAVKSAIEKNNLKLNIQDVGGNKGRTMKIDSTTGIVSIKTIGNCESIIIGEKPWQQS
jgi:chemotaxis protein CheD